MEVTMDFNETRQEAVLTFPTGKTLKLSNVDRARADKFLAEHAQEFAKRDLTMTTPGTVLTRGGARG